MNGASKVVAAAAVGFAILVGLGAWQLSRLHWKNGIVAQIETRRGAAAESLPAEAKWTSLRPEDYEYRHVAVNGVYARDKTALVYRGGSPNAPGAGPGYLVLTPLKLADDSVVIVNRGFAPLAAAEAARANAPASAVVLTGLMRGPEARNAFTPADDPSKGVWYTRDAPSIAAHLGLARAAPFTIDLDPDPKKRDWPRPGTTVIDIPNNHLSYALTWFGLALALVGVTAVFVKRGLKSAA